MENLRETRKSLAEAEKQLADVEADITAFEDIDAYCGLSWMQRRDYLRCREIRAELILRIAGLRSFLHSASVNKEDVT